jgi:hypothetical protein
VWIQRNYILFNIVMVKFASIHLVLFYVSSISSSVVVVFFNLFLPYLKSHIVHYLYRPVNFFLSLFCNIGHEIMKMILE